MDRSRSREEPEAQRAGRMRTLSGDTAEGVAQRPLRRCAVRWGDRPRSGRRRQPHRSRFRRRRLGAHERGVGVPSSRSAVGWRTACNRGMPIRARSGWPAAASDTAGSARMSSSSSSRRPPSISTRSECGVPAGSRKFCGCTRDSDYRARSIQRRAGRRSRGCRGVRNARFERQRAVSGLMGTGGQHCRR